MLKNYNAFDRDLVNPQSLPTKDTPEGQSQHVYYWDMRLIVNDENLKTIEQVGEFPEGSEGAKFKSIQQERSLIE